LHRYLAAAVTSFAKIIFGNKKNVFGKTFSNLIKYSFAMFPFRTGGMVANPHPQIRHSPHLR